MKLCGHRGVGIAAATRGYSAAADVIRLLTRCTLCTRKEWGKRS